MVSNKRGKQALAYGHDNQYDDHADTGFPSRMPADDETSVPRRWRQWYASTMEVEATPLEVDAPKRRRWGRFVYLAIVIAGVLLGLDFLAGHIFWYSAQGSVGGRQYQLSPTNVSTVKTIAVQPGQHVSKGQVLIRFKSPQLSQALAQAKANIANIESKMQSDNTDKKSKAAALRAEIGGLQAQYQALRQEYNSQQQQINSMESLAAKGALNFGDVRKLQQQQSQIKAQYSQIYAKIQSDRAQLKQLRAGGKGGSQSSLTDRLTALKQLRQSLHSRMQSLSLRAPISGIVAQVPVTEGQTVKPGQNAVVVVPNANQRTLLYFPPAARSRLKADETLSVTTPDGTHIPMRITHVYPSIQALPDNLQNRVNRQGPVIVAVARPANPKDVQKLPSGTPVTAHVPRWQAGEWLGQWWHDVSASVSQWI